MIKPKYKLGQKVWGVIGKGDERIEIMGKIIEISIDKDGIKYRYTNKVGGRSVPVEEEDIRTSPEQVRDKLLEYAKEDYEEEVKKINKAYKGRNEKENHS